MKLNTLENPSSHKSQSGTSLVETVIVATLLLIVVGAAVGLLSQLISSTSISAGKQDMEKQKDLLGALIVPDFENAGYGVSSFQNQNYGTAAASFVSNEEYTTTGNGEISRVADGIGAITSMTTLGSETGSVKVELSGASSIMLTGNEGGDVTLRVEEAGRGRFRLFAVTGRSNADLGEHTPGTSYRIGIVPAASGKSIVITRLAEAAIENVELARINENVPVGWVEVSAFIGVTGDHMRVEMTGAPLIQSGFSTALRSVLFYDVKLHTNVDNPVYQNPADKSVTIISGDTLIGLSFLKQTVNDLTAQTEILVSESEKRPLQVGDYCVLINYGAEISALLQIDNISITDPGTKSLTVSPVRGRNAAWGRFFATEESLSQIYGEGSRLVKLEPPVTYRVTDDKRLVREIEGKAETAAFNVKSFKFNLVPGKRYEEARYEIEVMLGADSRLTNQSGSSPVVRFNYKATPKALNVGNQIE